jgi:hypothetical protein
MKRSRRPRRGAAFAFTGALNGAVLWVFAGTHHPATFSRAVKPRGSCKHPDSRGVPPIPTHDGRPLLRGASRCRLLSLANQSPSSRTCQQPRVFHRAQSFLAQPTKLFKPAQKGFRATFHVRCISGANSPFGAFRRYMRHRLLTHATTAATSTGPRISTTPNGMMRAESSAVILPPAGHDLLDGLDANQQRTDDRAPIDGNRRHTDSC